MEVASRRHHRDKERYSREHSREHSRDHHGDRNRDRDRDRERSRDTIRDYTRKNNYEIDFNDISRASTPTSTFSSKSEGRKKEREHKYSIDDYKRKIARLKSELDLEKAKSKKNHKEKSVELREMRESYESQKQAEIDELEAKLKVRLDKERQQLEEELKQTIQEEKDKELQQVLKYKDDEMKELKSKYRREKESAIKHALDHEKKVIDDREKKLNDEMQRIKEEKEQIESEFKKKCAEETRKEKEFTKIKEEYDSELRRILGESKKLALGNMEKLKKAEKALSENMNESDDELTEIEFTELLADLHNIQSQASSRAVSRSVSTTSELKLEEVAMNINNLLASPAITPAMIIDEEEDESHLSVLKGFVDGKGRSSSAMSEPARELFSRKQEERDRQLVKKVSELQTQTQRLERKIALLKTENETLKRRQDDKKPLEEKIKTLKKRNAELAAIARRLEEKAKHLQQENLKKTKEITVAGQAQNPTGTESMKKMFARQRAKDLAEHARNMLSKDREIEELRKKCQELADSLSNSDLIGTENTEMYGEKEELVHIIKQAAKERLHLEGQLAIAKPGSDSKVVSIDRYKEIEETNEILQKEIQKLERVQSESERLEIELTQKKLECERLARDVEQEKTKSKSLASELLETTSKNSDLATRVVEAQERLQELDKVNEECSTLRLHLSDAQHECEVAKGEVSVLHLKVQNLETVVKKLEFSTEKLKQVESDYHESVAKLQEKQKEIDQLQKVQESAREKYEKVITSLHEKVKGLERQDHEHALKQQELTEEVIRLRAQVAKKQIKDIRSTEIQTGKSIEFTPSATSSPNTSPTRISPANHNSRKSPANSIKSSKSPATVKSPGIKASPIPANSVSSIVADRVKSPLQEALQRSQAVPVQSQVQASTPSWPSSRKINGGLSDQTESTKSTTDTGFADDDEVTQANSPDPDKGEFEDPELFEIAKKLKELEADSDSSEDLSKTDRGDDSGMGSKGDHRGDKDASEMSLGESRLSALSALAKKGPIQVYRAKYNYDPYKFSPNENPEAELPLQSGDYVLIYGEMDEDGFFDGELIDGRRGLVPSNFIEKVAEEDLADFHQAMAGQLEEDSTIADSVPQDLDFDSGEEMDKPTELIPDRVNAEVTSDLEDIEEEDEEHKDLAARTVSQTGAPFPKNLQLDRQLANSILVSWRPPDEISAEEIRSYHVFLDGDYKTAIRGNERTKALLENVESRKIHRVSVRCISSLGQSHDNQCTILVGKDVIPAPFDLRVSDITATTATITWTPGDSCLSHALFVNNVEIRVVRPGVFSHPLTGLVPATSHKVSIQAKNWNGKGVEKVKTEKLMSSVEFTTAAGGLPDPPISIQVEAGPQEGTILVTWLPVTIDTSGFSNGALISGYVVYADGQKAKTALGATNDHVILSSNDFHGFIPKELVVRSFTKDQIESMDSAVVRLPQVLIKEITVGAAKTIATEAVKKKSPHHGLDAEEEIDTAFKDINQVYEQNTILGRNYPEPFIDSSCSELSDIPEVDEVSSPEPTNENNPLKDTLHSLVNGLSGLSNESSDFEEIYQRNLTEEVEVQSQTAVHIVKPSKASDHQIMDQERRSAESKTVSPRAVPQIEITREQSTDGDTNSDTGDKKRLGKANVTERNSLGKLPSQDSVESVSKYSANKDKRDGYRDEEEHSVNTSDINSDINSKRAGRSGSRGQASPRGQGSPRGQASPRGQGSPRDKESRTPRGVTSPGSASGSHGNHGASPRNRSISPSTRDSPRARNSPRSRSSPGDRDRHHDNHNGHHEQHHKKSSASPNRNSHASPHRDRHGHAGPVSPLPSPISKSNSKGRGYHDDNNMSAVSSIDVISNKAQSDTFNQSDYEEGGDVDSISGEINPPIDDNRIRLFVALFDYDPESMSPNVESLEEELPFREGQIIKVYGDKDADGFYRGECGGRVGYIPCNMVSEIQVDDPELEDQLLREVQENGTVATSAVTAQLTANEKYMKPVNGTMQMSPSVSTLQPLSDSGSSRRMVALYDYDPQELSPNVDSEIELSFKTGEIIYIYGDMDEDGFYLGEINTRRGLVPSNFLQDAAISDDEALDSVSVITPARSGESINTSDSRKSEKSEVNDKQQYKQQGPSPTKMENTKLGQIDFEGQDDIGMLRPRSLTPDELKQKKKSGGFLSKGKNILKKFTR